MSCKGYIGQIVETGSDNGEFSTFEWRIPDFPSLGGEGGDRYESTLFNACSRRWWFKIYPNGLPGLASSNWVSLLLARNDAGPPQTLDVTLGIRGPEGVENKRGRIQEFSKDDNIFYWGRFCSRSKLTEQNSRLMPENVLIISLDMKSVLPKLARGIEHKVLEDMGKLLVSGNKSDISMQVKGTEFKVHSNILCARSAVLSAMLEHDTAERASNKIRIDDCEPEVFEEYLRYIYTGSIESLPQETVFGLYRVADKYLADDLKLLCLEHIQNTLCIQTFCDAMKLALTYGENDLLQRAIDFASKNFQSIIMSVEWQSFNCENPREANEILIKCFGPRR